MDAGCSVRVLPGSIVKLRCFNRVSLSDAAECVVEVRAQH